jgi:hypothetical protein
MHNKISLALLNCMIEQLPQHHETDHWYSQRNAKRINERMNEWIVTHTNHCSTKLDTLTTIL